MVKDNDILQAVREQDVDNLNKLLVRSKNGKKLLHGAKKLNVNFQDEDGMAAIHQAALQGNVDCINLLLNNGAHCDIQDNKGMRPVTYAAWQGLIEPVNILLQSGADSNLPSKEGETPLHFSCQHGHVEVVRLLLKFRADPTIENKVYKTPLDVACEFGKYQVAELLIHSSLCDGLLHDQRDMSADKNRSTALHLAARGGHTDIMRLLMDTNIDINRQTHQGTALHEAALYGKIQAVRLLIDAGIDVNVPNSYEQTALDIVHKFTRKAGAKELKSMLQEASQAICVRAVKSFSNSNDPQSLAFAAGDIITVTDQKPNGVWRGFVLRDGRKSTAGYFPSNCVAILDKPSRSGSDREGAAATGSTQLSGSAAVAAAAGAGMLSDSSRPWYSSTSLASSDLASPTVRLPNSVPPSQTNDSCNTNGGYHYPPPSPSYRAAEMAVIPENRISTCSRNSSTSNDSRHPHVQSQPQAINANVVVSNYPQRLSGHSFNEGRHSYESASALSRQSFHSQSSSSSVGSLDILDEGGFSSNVNVAELYQRGMSEADIIYTWLSDLRFELYFENFVQAGYDMPTMSRMTPEDLTAIGITKPGHRKKLKRELARLNIHDGIPDFMPSSVLEWLQCLGLDVYYETLAHQQYQTMDSVVEISWEDLEDIGINRLGHQKKIMLAVERLKKLYKRRSQSSGNNSRDSTPVTGPLPRWSADMAANGGGYMMMGGRAPYRSNSGENLSRESSPYSIAATRSINEIAHHRAHGRHASGGDVVPISVRGGLSRSSSGNSVNSSSDYAVPRSQSFTQPERDSTPPSSEDSGSSCSGSMQRKQSIKGPMKGIHGLTMSKHSSQDSIDQHRNSMDNVAQYATLRRTNSRKQSAQSLDFNPQVNMPHSPMGKGSPGIISPGPGSLPSPFANFRSPYAQIQSGEIKNSLSKENKRSSSVPSSPVSKSAASSSSSNSSTASKVKKPPAPPKRTMSMKTSNNAGETQGEEEEEVHEFPPPPPPIAFNLEAMKAHQPKNGIRSEFSSNLESRLTERRQSPFRDGLKLQNVNESSLAARRRAGSVEKEALSNMNNNNAVTTEQDTTPTAENCQADVTIRPSERSNSATPRNSTESIPFANDNAGTIRQKSAQMKTSVVTVDFLEEDLDNALESEDNEESDFDFDTVKRMPKPVMHVQPVYTDKPAVAMSNQGQLIAEQHGSNVKQERDVLNDIGSMLEDLTSELDAMLDTDMA